MCVCRMGMFYKGNTTNLALIICTFVHIDIIFSNFQNYRIRRILRLRLYPDDENRRWQLNIMEKGYEILCMSQITLYHSIKGNKIDFHTAMHPNNSRAFYERFITKLCSAYKPEKVHCKEFDDF